METGTVFRFRGLVGNEGNRCRGGDGDEKHRYWVPISQLSMSQQVKKFRVLV